MVTVTGYFIGDKMVGYKNGSLGGIPKYYNDSRQVDEADIPALLAGDYYMDDAGEDVLVADPTQEEVTSKKKAIECKNEIEHKYNPINQINVLRNGNQDKIDSMNTYIDTILTEYRTNLQNANFKTLFSVEEGHTNEITAGDKTVVAIEADYTGAELIAIAKYLTDEITFVSHVGTETQVSQAIWDHFNT